MFNVAIVEDEEEPVKNMLECFERYRKEYNVAFHPTVYKDAEKFLTNYRAQFDIVFMDIEMPVINGMTAARKLREMDRVVALVFITNISRYAIEGYAVDALDYILKPLTYPAFVLKIRKIINYCNRREKKYFYIVRAGTEIKLEIDDILYIEISAHNITYHTLTGNIEAIGTLREVEQNLTGCDFARCNRCYLINLKYVRKISGYTVIVGNEELIIAHSRKRDFMRIYNNYCKS